MDDQEGSEELSWRIPADNGGSNPRARLLVSILLLAVIYIGILWIFSAKAVGLPGLAAVIPLIAFMLFLAWRASLKVQLEGNNIRLSQSGLSWNDGNGASGQLPMEKIKGFRIGLDPDTIRAIPALTLILVSGFESQPVELHAPATPRTIREFLSSRLGIVENDVPDEEFATQLRSSHRAAFSTWDYDPHESAKLCLRATLIDPVKQQDGRWLLCSSPKLVEIIYDPTTCSYDSFATNGHRAELANVSELISHVDDTILPADEQERQQIEERLRVQEDEAIQISLTRDCRTVGFYVETDEYGCWHFVGTRESLLSFCRWMAQVADELKLPSVGERPATRKLGGEIMNVSVQVDHQTWIDDCLITGPKEFLMETANRMSESIITSKANSDAIVTSPNKIGTKSTFVFHVKEQGYDPVSRLISCLDS